METISIALVCTILGVSVSFLGFQRNRKIDTKHETRESTTVAVKLDYISKGVDDIRLDIKAQDKKIGDLVERVVKVEESTKSAHHRIDSFEKEMV